MTNIKIHGIFGSINYKVVATFDKEVTKEQASDQILSYASTTLEVRHLGISWHYGDKNTITLNCEGDKVDYYELNINNSEYNDAPDRHWVGTIEYQDTVEV